MRMRSIELHFCKKLSDLSFSSLLFLTSPFTYNATMKVFGLALLSTLALASATELTPSNWDSETAGKTVFIKFLAPW